MIISHKYKFLFIGLPFSASSAISKELNLKYDGRPLLAKHSLYHEFKKNATKEELEYFVFSVLRNPMEIVVTTYEKVRANSKGNFTNPDLFVENGGHITEKQRSIYSFIHNKQATFQQYFNKFFNIPYDNLAALTVEHCNHVIRYENLNNDYLSTLKKVGIKNPRTLPVANKTTGKKNDLSAYYTKDIKEKAIFIFGPFIKKYNNSFPQEWGSVKQSTRSLILFKVLGFLRKIKYKYFRKATEKFGLKGTIYGDMQRKESTGF